MACPLRTSLLAVKLQILLTFLVVLSNVYAGENGGSHYAGGSQDFMTGNLPPAGFYILNYTEYYRADSVRDNSGHKLPIDFHAEVLGSSIRLLHVTKTKVMSGDVVWYACIPGAYEHISMSGPAGNRTQTKIGIADVEAGPGIVWHGKRFHGGISLDILMPTGAYNKHYLANIGRNYWTFSPLFALKYQWETNVKNRPQGKAAWFRYFYAL
jgi:hypothetical protein